MNQTQGFLKAIDLIVYVQLHWEIGKETVEDEQRETQETQAVCQIREAL